MGCSGSFNDIKLTRRDYFNAALFAIAIIAGVVGLVVGIVRSVGTEYGPAETPRFHNGQMVRMKAFGHAGMVIGTWCPQSLNGQTFICTYTVRFPAVQSRTNTHLFGQDGPIDVAPVAAVKGIREYELEPAQ